MSDLKQTIDDYGDTLTAHEVGVATINNFFHYGLHPKTMHKTYKVLTRDVWQQVIDALIADADDTVLDEHLVSNCLALCFKCDAALKYHATGVGLIVDLSSQAFFNTLLTRESSADPVKVLCLEPGATAPIVIGESKYLAQRGSVIW